MSVNTDSGIGCAFAGDWTTAGVAAQLPSLLQKIDEIKQAASRPERLYLDLSGVAELDACGCQLLAAFVRALAAEGVAADCCGLPPSEMGKLRLLGFDAELRLTQGEPS
jgi:anti-anti-sigma regulatory factor